MEICGAILDSTNHLLQEPAPLKKKRKKAIFLLVENFTMRVFSLPPWELCFSSPKN